MRFLLVQDRFCVGIDSVERALKEGIFERVMELELLIGGCERLDV